MQSRKLRQPLNIIPRRKQGGIQIEIPQLPETVVRRLRGVSRLAFALSSSVPPVVVLVEVFGTLRVQGLDGAIREHQRFQIWKGVTELADLLPLGNWISGEVELLDQEVFVSSPGRFSHTLSFKLAPCIFIKEYSRKDY